MSELKVNTNLIALCGKAGAGKTTLANLMNEHMGYEILSFATPLKEIAREILDREIDKSKDRKFLIDLGAFLKGKLKVLTYPEEGKKDVYDVIPDLDENPIYFKENVWVNLLMQKIEPGKKYVIDDLRFRIEYGILRQNDFVIGLLDCTTDICEKRMIKRDGGFSPILWETPSEKEHLDFQYDIIVFSGQPKEIMYSNFAHKLEYNLRKDKLWLL